MAVKVETEKCDGCMKCAEACPIQNIEKVNDGTKDLAKVNEENCLDCYVCVMECKPEALHFPR